MFDNLKVDYVMDGDLPIAINARNNVGDIIVSAKKFGDDGKWELSAVLGIETVKKIYDHSGPAIEEHSWYVARVNEYFAACKEFEEITARLASIQMEKRQVWDVMSARINSY